MERAPPAYMGQPRRNLPSPGRQWFVARRFPTLAARSFQPPLHGFPSSSGCRHARHVIPKDRQNYGDSAFNSFVFGHRALRSAFTWLELRAGWRRSRNPPSLQVERRITPEPVIGPRLARTRWAPIRLAHYASLTRRANHLASARPSNRGVSIPLQKNISVFPKYKSCYMICIPSRKEGRWPSSRTLGRGAVDAAVPARRWGCRADLSIRERSDGAQTNGTLPGEASWRRRVAAYGESV